MKHYDLFAVVKYKNLPIRVGLFHGELFLSLSDLRMALGLPVGNVTNITRNMPLETYYRMSTVDIDGGRFNNTCIGVSRMGAYMALAKTQKVDQLEVLSLMQWVERLDTKKLKGA